MNNHVIQKAIDIVGSQGKLARQVGVNQSAVSKWLRGGGIRSEYISGIVAATKEQVTAADILASLPPVERKSV